MQSLGETQIDLGAPALVPPPTSSLMVEQSHDQRSHSPLVGLEGDINDAVIDNIVEEESSNGDEEEGKLETFWKNGIPTPFICEGRRGGIIIFLGCYFWSLNFL